MIDVTSFGANGHDQVDDTADIQKAIAAAIHHLTGTSRIVYFPAGTYLISGPLYWKKANNDWDAELTFQGEGDGGPDGTTIKLTDNNPAYQSTTVATPVIQTASFPDDATKDTEPGSGNDAFDNFLFDMTIDTGQGNPGATALDFMGNNYCGLRNVTLKSSDPKHVGMVGLSMTRYATGPCLFRNVTIDGFNDGVKTANSEYSMTFDGLHLTNQQQAGIQNTDNVLTIEDLDANYTKPVPVVQNLGTYAGKKDLSGLVTIIGASLKLVPSSTTVSAIQNHETLYARNVSADGYRSAIQDASGNPVADTPLPNEYDSQQPYTQFSGGAKSLNLCAPETPEFEETDLSKWESVVTDGADPTGVADSTAAIGKAMGSKTATTVYFPAGNYKISGPITVGPNIRMIEGFDSHILPTSTSYKGPLFVFPSTSQDVILDHIRFGDANNQDGYPNMIGVQNDSSHSVTIRDTVFDGGPAVAYQNGATGTGDLFLEDVVGGPWQIKSSQHVYARQLDAENAGTKVTNSGGTVWILGLKTEQAATDPSAAGEIDTRASGQTEVLGGLLYPGTDPKVPVPTTEPAFTVLNSAASFIYAVSNYNGVSADPGTADWDFKIQVKETQGAVTQNLTSATVRLQTPRGEGLMMPLYTSKPVPPPVCP